MAWMYLVALNREMHVTLDRKVSLCTNALSESPFFALVVNTEARGTKTWQQRRGDKRSQQCGLRRLNDLVMHVTEI